MYYVELLFLLNVMIVILCNMYKEIKFKLIYFIPSSESSAYLKQIKCILSAVKKYRIFSLVTDTIFIFSLQQTEAVSTILGSVSTRKDLECAILV